MTHSPRILAKNPLSAGALLVALTASVLLARTALAFDDTTTSQEERTQSDTQLLSGDRIRLNIFERVDLEEDQWAQRKRVGKPDQSFYPRQDLSGDFIVQSDGTLPLPLLGNIAVENRTASAVMKEIGERFRSLTTHAARVSYAIIERQPVSIVGPVKQPGVYKFVDGMTVFHVIALAGGYKAIDDSWGKVEFAKQNATLAAARRRWQRFAAETVVLRAERDHISESDAMKQTGVVDAAALEEACNNRLRARQSMTQRRSVLASSLAATEELAKATEDRVHAAELAVRDRRERVQSLRKLADNASIGRPVFLQANVELSEADERRIQAVAALSEAKYRLTHAKLELAKFDIDMRVELDALLTQRSQEAADADAALRAAEAAVLTLAPDAEQLASAMGIEIIRQAKTGWSLLPADSYATLKPGDLVIIGPQQSTARAGK